MKSLSIRFKITVITITAILIAILCIFAVSYPGLKTETDLRAVEVMDLIGEDTKNVLDEYFAGIEQSVRLAVNMAVDSLDSVTLVECGAAGEYASMTAQTQEQKNRLDKYISSHCAQVLEGFSSAASHTNGVVGYYYCISPEISEKEHGFFYSRVGKAGFVAQEPLDAGKILEEDPEKNPWYHLPVQHGQACWVGPYNWNFPELIPVCSYVMPVYSTGTLIGVIGMDIPMETLIEQVRPIRVYESGFASLYSEDGHVLYHPEAISGDAPDLSELSVSEEQLQSENSSGSLIRYEVDGQLRQMTFVTLRNGMKLFICAPVSEIKASWLRIIRTVLIVTILVSVFFAGAIMLIMGVLMAPLQNLTAASQKLADADYDVELNYRGRDEIGTLTVAFSRMRDRIKQYIEDLNRRVYTDSLTGLPNMRFFFRLAEAEQSRLLENGKQPVLLFFDMIGMKHYNRQYGFEEGDRLLCEVGEVLRRQYGEERICRFSEDHFVVVTDEETMEESLKAVFEECEEINRENPTPVRVGVYPDRVESVSVSVACDRAKYACEKHRQSYVSGYYVFDRDMVRELEEVRYIIRHLDQAIRDRWIRAYYQPIIRAEDGMICEEEALSRWIDPVRGLLGPDAFIPILEKARLIYKLDLYILDEVLRKMSEQVQMGMEIVPHSVNLSRADFDSCDIVEEIRRRVDDSGFSRSMFTIEVTESLVGRDFDFMKEQIGRFKSLGFRVWMDDFGSGYSALDMLGEIRFDLIKLDMRFLENFEGGEESRIILKNLIRMANEMGIETLCEGVETEAQVRFLRENGCGKLQGYYFSRPVPFEKIRERYQNSIQIGYENHEG